MITSRSKWRPANRSFIPLNSLIVGPFLPNHYCNPLALAICTRAVYHTRDANKAYDYEGQEVLTVVLGRDDAFSYLNTAVDEDRQKLLNRSNIFVDGKEFGLALNQRDSFNVQAFERSLPRQAGELPSAAPVNTELSPVITENTVSSNVPIAQSKPASNSTPAPTVVNSGTSPATTPVMTLQAKYEAQLNAMMKEDGAQFN